MQCATIEYARDVAIISDANSTEFDQQTPHRVIYKLRELLGVTKWAARCASARACKLEPGSFAHKAYGKTEISERHRHRYEFNREYEKQLIAAGLKITGRTPDENYVANRRSARTSLGSSAANSIRNSNRSRLNASTLRRIYRRRNRA